MVWLQSVEVQKFPKECAGREAESSLEVREEDDSLASTRSGHDLGARSTPLDASRHLPGAEEGLDGMRRYRGAFPASTACLGSVSPGGHGACRREEEEEERCGSNGERVTAEAEEHERVQPEQILCAETKQRAR
jgi:hypothetical protein